MQKEDVEAFIALPIIGFIGVGLAWIGSQSGALSANGWPIFALGIALAFFIQILAFIPAFIKQTEKYYDITGMIGFLSVLVFTAILRPSMGIRGWLLLVCVGLWTLRLGTFLYSRIQQTGEDRRFREIKKSFLRFLMTWSLQGLWISVSLAPSLAAMTSGARKPLGAFALLGGLIWAFGWGVEIIADRQKDAFRKDESKKGQFIQSGLWAWSRHPNYFGEITLWAGLALVALPELWGWQYLTLLSPVLIAILLIKISGIPMLEERSDEKWGGQADYETYKDRTSVLILMPPKK